MPSDTIGPQNADPDDRFNSYFTALIGYPLAAGIVGFFDSLGYADRVNPASIFSAMKNGLAAGASAIGLDVGASLLKSITGSSLLSAIGTSITSGDIFGQFFGIAKDIIVLSPFKILGGLGSAVQSFSSVIQEKGLAGALESFSNKIFGRQTIETVFNAGGIGSFLEGPLMDTTLPTGTAVKMLNLGGAASLFFDLTGKLIGILENGIYRLGEFVVDAMGEVKLLSGKLIAAIFGHNIEAGIINGTIQNFRTVIDGVVIEGEGDDGGVWIPGPGPDPGSLGGLFSGLIKVAGGLIAYAFKSGFLESIILGPSAHAAAIPITDPGNLTNILLDALRQAGKLTSEKAKEVKDGFKWLVHYTDLEGFDSIIQSNKVLTGNDGYAYFSKEIPTSEPAAREIASKLQLSYQGSDRINPEKAQYFVLIDANDLTPAIERPIAKQLLLDPDGNPQPVDQQLGYEYLFNQLVDITGRVIYGGFNSLVNWGFAIKGLIDHFLQSF